MQQISQNALLSSDLLDAVTRLYGRPVVVSLPPASLHDDPTRAFVDLLGQLETAHVVLFADIGPGDLDGFFRLRLAQVLAGRAALPALSVVVLSAEMAGPQLAGGFADRFRSGWPFARCVFLTDGGDHDALSALLGLTVRPIDDPVVIASDAAAGQAIAVQVLPAWGRCGSTILFENQLESLVQAGFLTIRLFTDRRWRRGATLQSRLDRIVPENSVHTGAHINAIAVPDGPPGKYRAETTGATWRNILAETANCHIRDDAVARAAGLAECLIVNRLECVGPALVVAPAARLLLSLQEDRAAALRTFALLEGRGEAAAAMFADAADHVQAQVLGIADICTFVSTTEMIRLAPWCRRAITIRPRPVTTVVPDGGVKRFDVLLTGSEDMLNIVSLKWFLNTVWRPHLEGHGISVAITGRAARHVHDAAARSPLVHFLGFVDNLEAIRSLCRLTVVPDIGRAGISAKLLDTLAAGHPVATTSAGLRGLDSSAAELLPAFDAPEALAADILDLIRSPARLAERQGLVRRVGDATWQDIDYAGLVMAAPRPSGPGVRKRLERWSRVAGVVASIDVDPHVFLLDAAFPMSGSPHDPQVLLDGWHEPEPWGRWTDGAVAGLRVTLPAPADEPLTLQLDIVPSAVGANLRIGWDGTMLALVDPVPGANSWDIPVALSAGKSSFVVSLHVGETVRPASDGTSVDDRILGIGVNSVCVLSRQPTLCEPGVLMPIRAACVPRQVLLTGWHAPEDWGCWTSKMTAALRVTLTEPVTTPVRLELELTLPPVAPTLTLSVNGSSLPAVTPSQGRNSWDLPARATTGRAELHVQLSVPETYCAARAGVGVDDRELGIGLRGIRLVPFVPAFHEPGTRVRLVWPEALGEILRGGWHPAEDWGSWTNGPDAAFRLAFVEPLSGIFRLEMDLAPSQVAPALTLSVNGRMLPAMVPANGSNSWLLPERLTAGQRVLLIGLHVSETFSPAALGGSADDRLLGIGVRWIMLHREAGATCPIGEVVQISSEQGDRGVLVDGWHKPEPWGCWSAGPDGSIQLRFDTLLTGSYVFEADMMPPLLNDRVVLSVNGKVLTPAAVVDGPNEWALPRNCTDGHSGLEIHFLVALPVRPMDVSDSTDGRVLGVGLRSFRVRAVNED